MTAQAYPQIITESTAPVSASASTVNIDLALLTSPALNLTVARQIMAIGDPDNPSLVADVVNHPCSGSEAALVTTLAPGSPDLRTIHDLLTLILMELRIHTATRIGTSSDINL
jgi:hypothetical protein